MVVYLGIDWSQTHHDACWLTERGQVLNRLTVPHTVAGLAHLDAVCQQLGVSRAECRVGLETAHTLLIDFLWDRGYSQVYVIPPGAIKGARRRYRQTNAHTDQSDAWLIADVLRTDPATLHPWQPDGLIVRQLRAKVSLLQFLKREIRRPDNRLQAVLARYYPAALQVFHATASPVTLRFLQAFPTPTAAADLTRQAFGQFARAHRYRQSDMVLSAAYARLQAAYPVAGPHHRRLSSGSGVAGRATAGQPRTQAARDGTPAHLVSAASRSRGVCVVTRRGRLSRARPPRQVR